jgi:hypothetical protein
MDKWDTIKQNLSNNYASVKQNLLTLPQSRWNLQGIYWSVCAVLKCCWQLEALRPQPQEWQFLHTVERVASCREVVSSRWWRHTMTRASGVVQACKPHTLPPQLQQKTRALRPMSVCGFIYKILQILLHNSNLCTCTS